ncbi:MAG: GNAT family N-acetyltransferase [Dehalococcoidia bacterium]
MNTQASAVSSMDVRPVTLTGQFVELRPLALADAAALFAALDDEDVWTYLPSHKPAAVAEVEASIAAALRAQEQGVELPFVTIHRESGKVAGMTRLLDISVPDRHAEIGWTAIGPEFQRTAVNTEAKYLMLRHAFESWGCIRVQLKTDLRNERSQRAIERLGAVREGVLRKVRLVKDGYQRSSVFYSITDDEWPSVKAHLETKLGLSKA